MTEIMDKNEMIPAKAMAKGPRMDMMSWGILVLSCEGLFNFDDGCDEENALD